MIGLILLIVLAVSLIAGCVICTKNDLEVGEYICGLFGGFACVGLLFAIIGICILPSDSDAFVRKRDKIENLVESINDKMTTETINSIVSDALYVNSKIEDHRKHVDSKFSGVFYSHKVAELELIELPELTVAVTNEKTE